MGQSPSSDTYNTSKNGLPFYQGNADFGDLYPHNRIWCSAPKKIAHRNDLLISVRAPIGAVNIATETCCIGRGLAALAPNENCSLNYLFYAVKNLTNELEHLGTGSTFKAINKDILENIPVPYYDKLKQELISQRLSLVDRTIFQRKSQLKLFDELIKSRFVEMFGDPIHNTRELPQQKLGNICNLKAGEFTAADLISQFPSKEKPYPCYGGNGIRGYVDNYTHNGNYSLIGRQGALCGNVQYATGKFRNTEHAVLVEPKEKINSIWLFVLLKLEDLYRFHKGAAQPGLSVNTLNVVEIPLASQMLQAQFADFVQQVDKSRLAGEKASKIIQNMVKYKVKCNIL